MTLHRAFVPSKILGCVSVGTIFELPEDVSHRLNAVLRLSIHETVELFDGMGLCVQGRLVSQGQPHFLPDLVQHKKNDGIKLSLVQAWVKQDKLEEIVQHATELGVHQFVFFVAKHSIVKLTERTPSQVERLRRIATDAARQSERSDIPELFGPLSFLELNNQIDAQKSLILVGEPREAEPLMDVLSKVRPGEFEEAILVVGPEGGMDACEIAGLKKLGAKMVRYAPHVLRAQTAGLVGMSIVQSILK